MHTNLKTIHGTRPVRLRADATATLSARPGQQLVGVRGVLWITQDGDPRDIFVAAGERFVFDRRGTAVVHALREAGAFVVVDTSRPRPGVLASLAGVVHALLAGLRAQRRQPVAAAPVRSATPRTVRAPLARTPGAGAHVSA